MRPDILAKLSEVIHVDADNCGLRATLDAEYSNHNPVKNFKTGWTELHHLARFGKPGKVIELLDRPGVDPSQPARYKNKGNSTTPLHLAAYAGKH